MDTKDYRSYAQMKPEGLNFLLDTMSLDSINAQKAILSGRLAELIKTGKTIELDIKSNDILIRLKESGYKFGDLFYDTTDENLDYTNKGISPKRCWELTGIVGEWVVIKDINSSSNVTRHVSNFPSKNFIKK